MTNSREECSEVEPVKGLFSDHRWGAEVLKAGANHLKRSWFDGDNNSFEHIKRVRVIFDKNVSSVEYENDFGNRLVTIYAPIVKDESDEELQERHRFLLKYYGNGIQEAHLNVVAKFLSFLSFDAQKNLVNEEREINKN